MKRIVLILTVLTILTVTTTVHADTVMNWDPDHPFLSGINQGTTPTCWAASASYMLAFSGWGLGNQYAVYQDFTSHWPNQGGDTVAAIAWYLDAGIRPPSGISLPSGSWYLDDYWPQGGAYYPGVNWWDVVSLSYDGGPQSVMSGIEQYINAGDAVGVVVFPAGGAGTIHIETIWGYDTDSAGNMTALYYTDSYGDPSLTRGPIHQLDESSGRWGFMSQFGYYAVEAIGLEPEQDYFSPGPAPVIPTEGNSVPEPGVVWLLGFSLLLVMVTANTVKSTRNEH